MKNQELRCDAVISFTPLADEVSPGPLYTVTGTPTVLVPQQSHTDPGEYAQSVKKQTPEVGDVCVLIPGTAFDRSGTRHGRGGGWYDRFLSAVPPTWTRIGVCSKAQLRNESLIRQPWDEPVDYLAIVENNECELIKTNSRL